MKFSEEWLDEIIEAEYADYIRILDELNTTDNSDIIDDTSDNEQSIKVDE